MNKSLTMPRKAPHRVVRMRALAKVYAEWWVTHEKHAVENLVVDRTRQPSWNSKVFFAGHWFGAIPLQ